MRLPPAGAWGAGKPTAARSLDQKGYATDNPRLWRAVLLNAGLHCLFSMASSMNCIAAVDVSRVCRGFVASSLVMFGGYRRRD